MNYNSLREERYKANLELLELLTSLVHKYPDMRFSQIMSNFDFVKLFLSGIGNQYNYWEDEYYLEPMQLLERVKQTIKRVEQSIKDNEVKDEI